MKRILLFTAFLLSIIAMYAQSADIEKKDFYIDGAHGKLYAILQYPEEVKHDVKFPLVIICHGFTANCNGGMETSLADAVVKNGMAALRFDFNGHGKSEGRFEDMTVLNEIEDLKCVIDWARKQPWVESIALTGHSQGGVVVSMTAGELGDSIIKAEVLMAPAAVLRDDALRGNVMGASYDPWTYEGDYVELPIMRDGENLKLGRAYWESARILPIYETARRYEGPTLIFHGTHDRVVPYTYGERFHQEIKGSELHLIEGDDHGFMLSTPEICSYTASWLKSVLKPNPVNPVKI